MRKPSILIVQFICLAGCVHPPFDDLSQRYRAAQPESDPRQIVSVFDGCGDQRRGALFMPADDWLCTLTPSLALVGAMTRDIEQKVIDQTLPETVPAILHHTRVADRRLCEVARQPPAYAGIIRGYTDGGNPPAPYYQPAWFPVPLHDRAPEPPADATCPASPGDQHLCIFGQLALQPEPAPVVVVAPGLFDSQRQGYVQRAGAALFASGFGALLVDMRDHGHTFRAQPWAHATLGRLEGADLLAIGRRLRSIGACAAHAEGHGVGLLGFSAGGLAAIHAYVLDATASRAGHEAVFTSGAMAMSPLLDPSDAIGRLDELSDDGDPPSCSILTMLSVLGPESGSRCLAEGSIGHLFHGLVQRRFSTLRAADLLRADLATAGVAGYFEHGLRRIVPYPHLPPAEIVRWTDPVRLADRLAGVDPSGGLERLYILSSADDPVVGVEGIDTLVERVGLAGCAGASGGAPVCPLRVRFGGHASFSVISPSAIRRLLATGFVDERGVDRRMGATRRATR